MDLIYLLQQPEFSEKVCTRLTTKEIILLRESLGNPELSCVLSINDVDNRINYLYPINDLTVQLYRRIKDEGFSSGKAFIKAIHERLPNYYWGYLNRGVDINAVNELGYPALLVADVNGQLELVRELLNRGVDSNTKNQAGITALMMASFNGHREIVEELLNRGANINAVNNINANALFYTIRNQHTEIAKILINQGINTQIITNYGTTLRRYARKRGSRDIEQLILEKEQTQ